MRRPTLLASAIHAALVLVAAPAFAQDAPAAGAASVDARYSKDGRQATRCRKEFLNALAASPYRRCRKASRPAP